MGCGKSKHNDVATDNTVALKKSVTTCSDKPNETAITNAEEEKTKLIAEEKKEEKEEEPKESPNRFLSPRKNKEEEEEAVDGIVSDKSDQYFSPRVDASENNVMNVFTDKFEKVEDGGEELLKETGNGIWG